MQQSKIKEDTKLILKNGLFLSCAILNNYYVIWTLQSFPWFLTIVTTKSSVIVLNKSLRKIWEMTNKNSREVFLMIHTFFPMVWKKIYFVKGIKLNTSQLCWPSFEFQRPWCKRSRRTKFDWVIPVFLLLVLFSPENSLVKKNVNYLGFLAKQTWLSEELRLKRATCIFVFPFLLSWSSSIGQ